MQKAANVINRWDIESNYGYGWELETSEYSEDDARRAFKEYQDNLGEYSRVVVRLKRRREAVAAVG